MVWRAGRLGNHGSFQDFRGNASHGDMARRKIVMDYGARWEPGGIDTDVFIARGKNRPTAERPRLARFDRIREGIPKGEIPLVLWSGRQVAGAGATSTVDQGNPRDVPSH